MTLPVTRRAMLGLMCGAVALRASAQPAEQAFTGLAGTQIRFASVDTAQSLLAADDDWLAATGDFQRQAVMGRAQPVSLEDFRRWNRDAARPWTDAQRARWTSALQTLAPAIASLRIPLPSVVHLVATNGQESAGAPYTRANAVMLPPPKGPAGPQDVRLLAHELWHVSARHAPATASRLYAEVGFQPMPALRFPQAWQPSRIANPDAPTNAHAMRRGSGADASWITPVLVASRTTLQPGESFFDVMDVRLLEVVPGSDGQPSTAVMRDGEPRWYPLAEAREYLQQLGGNTPYVIHYEEAIAENIVLLASGGRARNPALLERLRAALQAG